MSGAGLQAFYRRARGDTVWGLGFTQYSFHLIARALRNQPYNAFDLAPISVPTAMLVCGSLDTRTMVWLPEGVD